MNAVRALRREVERLKALEGSRRHGVPEDRLEFAHTVGLADVDPWQEDLLRSEAPRILLNCSRQAGKSTMSGIVALHQALTQPQSLVLVLAPSERQSKELFSKIAGFYRELGQVLPADSYRKLGMQLANGSRIEALPGTEKTIRGFSGVSLLIVDEASRIDDALYFALRPMLAVSGGHMMMLSSPAGRRGVFYEEWAEGESWDRYEVPAEKVPRISPEFLEEERRALPDRIYRQEYCCEFLDTDDQVFGSDLIQSAITDDVTPLFEEAS